jgi:dTDP-4-amino-4,6-dideoxy-D-glucose acyltransferase
MSFLTREQLECIGFASLGTNVLISDKASIYNPSLIQIGSHVRIDDFCVLSAGTGGIILKDYIHIATYSSLMGAGEIFLSNFCGLSSRVSIYSSSDDYSGKTLTNPTIPDSYKGIQSKNVFLGKHTIVGCGSVILPGVILNDGVAVGALSLVTKNCDSFGIYAGNPARRIKSRSRKLLETELIFLSQHPPS